MTHRARGRDLAQWATEKDMFVNAVGGSSLTIPSAAYLSANALSG